jgi:predicted nuclease with TOPRIM domain
MTTDEWELMAAEFDRLLKEAGENGMTYHEFQERMTRLSWEMEQLKEIEEQIRKSLDNGTEKNPSSTAD